MADYSTRYVAPVGEDGKLINYKEIKDKTKQDEKTQTGSKLGYDQFLTLLCAEMQYQDPLEPTSNTEYVAQLATFSQLEAVLGLQKTEQNNMANQLVGKYVIINSTDSTTGKQSFVDGKVDYVMYNADGSVSLSVNNRLYNLEDLDTVADAEYYEAAGIAKTFDALLALLPDVEDITVEYEEAIKQIRDLYDGMTDYQRKFVDADSVKKFQEYEQRLAFVKGLAGGNEDGEGTEGTEGTENVEGTDPAEGSEGTNDGSGEDTQTPEA